MSHNFKQAFKEVLSGLRGQQQNEALDENQSENKEKKSEQTTTTISAAPKEEFHPEHREKFNLHKDIVSNPEAQATVISDNTKIIGTINTDSKLIIAGVVEGDIESSNDMMMTGSIRGDIKCKSAVVNAEIYGDLDVADRLNIKSDSKITGNISAGYVEIAGEICGNIKSLATTKLYSSANVRGDITTASIMIENGAVLKGNIEVQTNESDESY